MLVVLVVFYHLLRITNGGIDANIDSASTCVQDGTNSYDDNTGTRNCEEEYFPFTCKNMKVDVGFLLDASANLQHDFQNEKKFLKFVATAFNATDSRVGVIAFGDRAFHDIRLNEHMNSSMFSAAVDTISLVGSSPRRDKALHLAFREFFTPHYGARRGTSRLMILLTNDSRVPSLEIEPHFRRQGMKLKKEHHPWLRQELMRNPSPIAKNNTIALLEKLERQYKRSVPYEFKKRDINVIVVSTGSGYNRTELIRLAGSGENLFHAKSFAEHLRSNVAKTIIGRYCRNIKLPEYPWVKQELIRNPTPITKNTTIAFFEKLEAQYKVILQFMPSDNLTGWSNVLHFTTGGFDEYKYGDRIPAIYYNRRERKLEISSAVSGNAFYYKHILDVYPNTWHTVEISQQKEDGGVNYYYSIVVNGNRIVKVVNDRPEVFYNVTAYCSDPWYVAQSGLIRNLYLYRRGDIHVSHASASSVYQNNERIWGAALAWKGGSGSMTGFFHSKEEVNPWLQIQLNQPTPITSVTVMNRIDCCGDRLRNLEVRAGMKAGLNNEVVGEFKGPGYTGGVHVIRLNGTVVAQNFTLQLRGNGFLQVNGIRLNQQPDLNSDPDMVETAASIGIRPEALTGRINDVNRMESAPAIRPKAITAKLNDNDKDTYTRTAGVVISVGFLAMIGAGFL